MSRSKRLSRWYLIPMVLLISMSAVLVVAAAARVTPSESTLTFKGLITDPQQRTLQLAVDGGPITNVQMIRHDLVDPASGAVILSSSIVVEPAKIDRVDDTADLAVTLSGVKSGGHYTGTLDIRYVDQGITQTLTIALDAQLAAVPSVDVTADSKKLTWFVTEATSSTQPVFLTQKVPGEAEVQEANILVMRGSKGQSLPDGQVNVVATLPALLSPASTLPITVHVQSGVPAGEYNGTLLLKVRNQPAGIEVPIVVRSKHPPYWPLLTLAAGLATAAILSWWNTEGQKKNAAREDLITLRAKLSDAKQLAGDQVEAVIASIAKVAQAMNTGGKADDIDALAKAASQKLTDEIKRTDDLLAEIDKQLAQVQTLKPGDGVRGKFKDRLTALRERTAKGEWTHFKDAQADKVDVQTDLDFWAKVIELLGQVPAEKQAEATAAVDKATTLNLMQDALKPYELDKKLLNQKQGRTFGTKERVDALWSAHPELQLSFKTELVLSGGKLVVGVIAYVFALAVGFITLYMVNDTFGVDAQQYLSLFVWGAAVETVRAKSVTLTNLKAIMPNAGGGASGGNAAPDANPPNT